MATPYSNDRLQAAIERVARILGQDLTTQNPILNTRLPDGSSVAVVGAPSSINGPTLTIRKFNRWYTSDELIAAGSLPESVRDEVINFISERKNGIISGGTSSGKTTLMKALLDHVPQHERLVVIEQPAELKVNHPNAVRWEAVEAIPGQVGITPSQLLAAALRHRPDRIIMGEIRDECGYDLLQAMNTGHGGTLSTIHAKSAWDALNRLSDLALSAKANLNTRIHTLGDSGGHRLRSVLRARCHGPPPGARADYRQRIHPRRPELPDGGHLSCFRRLSIRHTAREPNPNRGHSDVPSCCQIGCTAQLVSKSAQRGVPASPRAERRVL